ncbi:tRNA epoxyqueuosine(34) reductase QueG [Paenibacillus sp.]|jgi:epoxyqueuosine reductase|uniref:tRNA epoxyqueuosine(34) reductase QueG n=1 Tax=Paenibacillus sp. TaxID=58172 RepID=UPI00282F7A52|nr:tRNA epoxyqueuosine(34) reductase QueG [Paenibacillus sp.]MDR0268563.1 tRNA epoxyqueuosine(34) reductase QueG [Paenibacillus sp.]
MKPSSYAPPSSPWEQLKQDIKEAAADFGIDEIGFASADPFVSLKAILQNHRDLGYESGFEEPDLDKRITPELPSAEPASLISIAIAYSSKMIDAPKNEPGKYRGVLSRTSWGKDYHHVLREAMGKLEDFIREKVPDAVMESMVDTGALVDRAVAERAGIGFSAKNCSIISPKWGSWIFLGEMVTNIPFPPDAPVTEDCGDCTMCIDACPTGALVGPGQLNAQRCISFLTQTKGFLPDEIMRKIGNRLYGCDTCQVICPKNKGKHWTHNKDLLPVPEKDRPLLLPILDLTNREFKEKFGESAAAWRGRKPIQRNAVIALGNYRDKSAVPKLGEVLLKDPRSELRGAAAWSLGRIGGEEALNIMNKSLADEQDEKVREMLGEAKEQLQSQTKAEAAEAKSGAAEFSPSIGGESETIYYDEMQSKIGPLTVCATEKGLCLIEFGSFNVKEAVLQKWSRTWCGGGELEHDDQRLAEVKRQLGEYFAGQRQTFDLPLDLRGTKFQLQVWTALADIHYGEIRSYGVLAKAIGRPKAMRAVSGAVNKNPVPVVVPCHRVLEEGGSLAGYSGGPETRRKLLSLENALPERNTRIEE